MDDEIVRFIVSTDNHLGYCDRDPVRCNDSFAAFEEVLRNAVSRNVDFVLLAGDLFHENKPTRKTMHATLELLRKYCLGPEPVYLEILNDQREIFKSSNKVNYEDPFYSVKLPVFSIHGNHDDPSREGGTGEALAALDLLSISNLVNYFGKTETVDDVEITPILMQKGSTKVALYGIGAIRDERLNRMWNQKRVKFVRLSQEQGRDEFFNIFVIHQNRDYGRGKKNCIHESMIPEWIDLVIWGNEHECIPQLQESLVGTYRILQPGSSVACSLTRGESSLCPKHMAYFEIKERKFRMKPIKYQQIRQFWYDEICLKDFNELSTAGNRAEEIIKQILNNKITAMLNEARKNIVEGENPDTKFKILDPKKVLLRLKVDYEGFNSINHQRFGSQYVAEVANPADILLLTKKRKEPARRDNQPRHGELRQLLAEGEEDEINRIKIEDLVNETLSNSRYSLSILTENEMAQALDDYIVKKLPNAIQDLVSDSLERIQHMLSRDQTIADKSSVMKAAERCRVVSTQPQNNDVKTNAVRTKGNLISKDVDIEGLQSGEVESAAVQPLMGKVTRKTRKKVSYVEKIESDEERSENAEEENSQEDYMEEVPTVKLKKYREHSTEISRAKPKSRMKAKDLEAVAIDVEDIVSEIIPDQEVRANEKMEGSKKKQRQLPLSFSQTPSASARSKPKAKKFIEDWDC